jgi:hypothetical protein
VPHQVERESREMSIQQRAAQLMPGTFNEADNTVDVVWTAGARGMRFDYWTGTAYEEELDVTPQAVNMSRFEAGAVPVLDAHRTGGGVQAILGRAIRGSIVKGEGRATIALSQRDELAGIVRDIKAGIIRNVSFGYSVELYETTAAKDRTDGGTVPLYRATRWTPQELSFVPVGFDPSAGTRSQPSRGAPCEFIRAEAHTPKEKPTMPTAATTAPEDRALTRDETVQEIRELGARFRQVPKAFIDGLIERGASREAAGLAVLDEMARIDRAAGGHLNVQRSTSYTDGGESQSTTERDLMTRALVERLGGPRFEGENPYRSARLADMQRALLELRGVRTAHLSTGQLFDRDVGVGAHLSGDFPELLQGAGNRTLRNRYAAARGGMISIARPSTVRDFRAKQLLALGEAPQLLQVNESGEFKSGTMAELKSTYSLGTYGRIFGITRQALINDDLSAFGELLTRYGTAAAQFESQFIVTLVTSNPTMADGLAVFHASHGNLATGAPSALQFTSLATARTAMRLQKGLDGKTAIDAAPTYLVVPAALETTAEQLVTTVQPRNSSDVNPFGGKLQLIVDPRLDAVSSTAWYLSADPAMIDTIEYSYLDSAAGPEVMMQTGFEVDGIQMKVRLDFGAGIIDYRGLYKSNGA